MGRNRLREETAHFAHEHETKQLWQSERTGPQRVSCGPVRLREPIVNGVFRAR